MIRAATTEDLGSLDRMVCSFRAEVPLAASMPYSRRSLERLLESLTQSSRGYATVLDLDGPCGVLLAAASPFPFAPILVADEILWWVDPPQRGKWANQMLQHYENWAASVGAGMVGLNYIGKSADALYRRRGYAIAGEAKYYRMI